jgi:drug/metabolite transporter (DMT)-like permease
VLTAVVGGLGAALCFAAAALCASSASREIGAASTLGWVMSLGMGVIIVPLVLFGHPSSLSGRTIALLCVAGLGNIGGLLLEYVAIRRVAVGIVTAVASTEGMVAAVLSSVFGSPLATSTVILLVVMTVGVVLAAAHFDPQPEVPAVPRATGSPRWSPPDLLKRLDNSRTRSTLLVVPVAILFGVTLYCIGRAGAEVPLIWVLLPARLFGALLIAAPLVSRRKLRISRRTFPIVLTGAIAEVVGLVSYTFGARQQLAVAAVLASQYAAITSIAAFFLFGDRLRRHQVVGIVLVLAGIVTLSALGG